MFLKFSFHIFLLLSLSVNIEANTYYISNSLGNDNNNGLSSNQPFKSIEKLNSITFQSGDSILFKSGDIWDGMFWLKGSGTNSNPIVVNSFGNGAKPIINGSGYQACILIYNNENIEINNLELTNETSHLDSLGNTKKLAGFGGVENTWGSGKNVRFGIKIVGTTKSLSGFKLKNLTIHDVFPTPDLAQHIHKGYGIKLETQSDTSISLLNTISKVIISNCTVTKTGHYGIWIKSLGLNKIDSIKNADIEIYDCSFENTGGSGFVPNKSENILVHNCIFNHSGSNIDSRMWKRGSGMWPFDCKNVVSEHNYFMNAHGPQDSYGSHIDFGNENVVFQYNYSYNNEGGFIEILGDNINCGYRYNVSVNDGYRIDPDGNSWDKKGKIFWVSNYCGTNNPRCPSIGSFIYNNTVFVNDTIYPEIYFWPNVGDVHVYNNLIYVGSVGDKIPTLIQNTGNNLNISHNLFYDSARMELDHDLINNAIFSDPNLVNPSSNGIDDPLMYQLQNNSIAIGAGKLISGSNDSIDYLNNNGGLDYLGNLVSNFNSPDIGAFNLNLLNNSSLYSKNIIAYPSLTKLNVKLYIKNYSGVIATSIFDINGVFLKKVEGDLISLKEFKKGIYIFKIIYGENTDQIKVIKI
ncbi:MAG: hypothetical protein CL846_04290 [Crocinitomicaceae bacterium]|nr:hypothetical protein [Crocinitomicaceae bacterium]